MNMRKAENWTKSSCFMVHNRVIQLDTPSNQNRESHFALVVYVVPNQRQVFAYDLGIKRVRAISRPEVIGIGDELCDLIPEHYHEGSVL